MDNKDLNRLAAVKYYLTSNTSLRKTAARFNVNYRTLFKWVKLYREQGMARLLMHYWRPWNRFDKTIEEHIVNLKEKYPGITLKNTQKLLANKGINLSIKGIWSVWKRFGYAGFNKQHLGKDFTKYGDWSQEARKKLQGAQQMFDEGQIAGASDMLNSIPFLPDNELLQKIPNHALSLKRRVEKIQKQFGQIPLPKYIKIVRQLYSECKTNCLNYSAWRVGIIEAGVLTYRGTYSHLQEKIDKLESLIKTKEDDNTKGVRTTSLLFEPIFTTYAARALIYASALKLRSARRFIGLCRRLITRQRKISADFLSFMGTLYVAIEENRKAEQWFLRAAEKADNSERRAIENKLAYYIYYPQGKYSTAIKLLQPGQLDNWIYDTKGLQIQADIHLTHGEPQQAIQCASRLLSLSKKNELYSNLRDALFIISSAYNSLGEHDRAEKILNTLYQLSRKYGSKKPHYIIKICIGKKIEKNEALKMPTIKLASLIKKRKILKAYTYAKKKGILGTFSKYLLLMPEVVYSCLKNGEKIPIPPAMKKLPIFNKKILVYNIKFLGKPVIYREQKYLKLKMTPIETAFVIHFALRSNDPVTYVLLDDIFNNFWPNRTDPAGYLSNILVRVKNKLKIPSHLLKFSHQSSKSILINRGIRFVIDYTEAEQAFARAHAFERVDEWKFARREYLNAFRLFRGEPFKKMYDNWSENMRRVILNRLEKEAIHFAQECLKRRNKRDAKRVLEKVTKIIPNSEETTKMLQIL